MPSKLSQLLFDLIAVRDELVADARLQAAANEELQERMAAAEEKAEQLNIVRLTALREVAKAINRKGNECVEADLLMAHRILATAQPDGIHRAANPPLSNDIPSILRDELSHTPPLTEAMRQELARQSH